MTYRYRALLVGNWHFPEDPANLPDLKGPMNDVVSLAEALTHPETGLFQPQDVTTLTERTSHEITEALEHFFVEASRDDLLLVYYSGHGLTDNRGESLLLCGRNSRTDRKIATMVSSRAVNAMIDDSPATAVIVLDCCHSGAFKSGEVGDVLAGRGRHVIASCRSQQRAPDADSVTGLSRFTHHLVRGLRGGATAGGDVTLSDLYRYLHREMTRNGQIIPQRRFDGDGEIAICRGSAPAPAVPTAGSGLRLSESAIDLGEVEPDEELTAERVYVSGARGPWTAATRATWVRLETSATYVDLHLTPRPGGNRAAVEIHDPATGEVRVVRVFVRVRRPPDVAPHPVAEPDRAPPRTSGTSAPRESKPPRARVPTRRPELGAIVIGIDLGATNAVVAVADKGKVAVVANAGGGRATPCIVGFSRKGEVLVGDAAKRQAVINPAATVRSASAIVGNDRTFDVGSATYDAKQITAQLLEKLAADAEARLGKPVRDVVITVPLDCTDSHRTALEEAGRIAKLNVLSTVDEATAAVYAYDLPDPPAPRTALVFHLGGSSCGVAVLRLRGGSIDVRAASTDRHIGGEVLDQRIAEYLVRAFHREHGVDLSRDKMAMQRLTEAAEHAKIQLSTSTHVSVDLPYIIADTKGNPLHLHQKLPRDRLDRMADDVVARCGRLLEHVIADAGLTGIGIDYVLLDGAATRMPAVSAAVRRIAGQPLDGIDPAETAAIGAARFAATLTRS